MICVKCNKPAVKDNLCRTHYIEEKEKEFLDNTDPNNLGIIKWLKYMYPEHYRNEFSSAHIEVYLTLLRLYDRRYINKTHRLRELIAFRGFAKSKMIFGFISYIIAHNDGMMKFLTADEEIQEVRIDERYIVLFSETATMAEEFVVNIRDEFSTNQMLKYFYHFEILDAIDSDTGQWTRKAFKINGVYIVGLGAKQQARGKIKGAYRPTMAFFDDIYSENNTKTQESRYSIKSWFYNSAVNTVDDLLGKVFLVGTIVHEDTVLVECERSSSWKTLKYTPMKLTDFKEVTSTLKHTDNPYDVILPYDDEKDEFKRIRLQKEYFDKLQSKYDMTWKDRMDLYTLVLKYKEAYQNQNLTGFFQEYFHELIPQELKRFNSSLFQYIDNIEIKNEYGYNWIKFNNEWKIINIEFGIDIAGGKNEGDNSAITVVGMLPDGTVIVIEQSYGKYTIRDVDFKKGYIDETLRLAVKYNPRIIKIGLGGGHEGAIIEEFRRVFNSKGIYIPIIARPQNRSEGEKFERIERTLLPYYEAKAVYHTRGLQQLEYELEFLRKARSDDCADSLEVAMWNILKPVNVNKEHMGINIQRNNNRRYVEVYDWLLP